MQISFWSNMHGQGAVSSTAAALASALAQMSAFKILVAHNHIERSAIEGYLFKNPISSSKAVQGLSNQGVDALLRLMKNGRLKADMVADYTYSLLKDHRLDLLMGTAKKDRIALEDYELMLNILSCAKDFYDLVLVDVHSGLEHNNCLGLLETSDIIVFCISQNTFLLDDLMVYFDQYKFLRKKQAVFVISRYEKNAALTSSNLARRYDISKALIFEVPNSSQFLNALNTGRVFEYIVFNQNSKEYEEKTIIKSLNRLCDYIVEGCSKNCRD